MLIVFTGELTIPKVAHPKQNNLVADMRTITQFVFLKVWARFVYLFGDWFGINPSSSFRPGEEAHVKSWYFPLAVINGSLIWFDSANIWLIVVIVYIYLHRAQYLDNNVCLIKQVQIVSNFNS